MRAARIAAHEVRLSERRDDFFGRRENPLVPDDRDRIILAGVLACDRVKTLRRNSDGDLAIGSRNDAIDAKALVVAEQRGNLVAVRGRIEFDHAVASRVVHVDDMETESLDHRGQHQPGAIHGIGKGEVERQVVGAGATFVGGEHHEGLRGSRTREAVVEAEFGDGRAGAANVSGRCVDEKILAGAVEPGGFRDRRGREERLPGELMYLGVPFAPCVRHDDRNVVAGVADETVDQQTIADRLRDLALDSRHHTCRRFRMPADGADVSLDDRKSESHEHFLRPAQRLGLGACCAGATALLIRGKERLMFR